MSLTVGLFVVAGWTLDMEQLTYVVPGWPRMSLLTAVSFMLAGVALWLTLLRGANLAIAAAGLLAAIGLLILVRNVTGWNAHLEQFSLAAIPPAADMQPPARMAPATACALIMFGLSLIFSLRLRTALLHQGLAIAALLTGWLGISRYLFGGEALFAVADMSVHAACLILLLCAGALTLRTDAGIAALLASDGVGGGIARRLLPAAVIVPLVAGALTIHYERRATFSFEAAVAVFALASMIAFVAFVWANAERGERADRLRRTAERALRLSEERHQLNFETALDAIVMIDARGKVTGWNTQAEKMFGWPRGDVLGRELAELIIPEASAKDTAADCAATSRPACRGCSTSASNSPPCIAPDTNSRRAGHHADRLWRRPGVQRIRA